MTVRWEGHRIQVITVRYRDRGWGAKVDDERLSCIWDDTSE